MTNMPMTQERSSEQAIAELGCPDELNTTEYNRLVDCTQLQEIRLVESSFTVSPEYFSEDEAEKNFEINRNEIRLM